MRTPGKRTVELFYDVISPYSWIGFERLCRYSLRWNIDLKFKPFFLAGIRQKSGNKHPVINVHKARYGAIDLNRRRDYLKIPINRPKDIENVVLVKGSLSAQRLITAVSIDTNEKVEDISRQIFLRIWSKDEDITQPESLLAAATSAGISVDKATKLVERIKDQDVKVKLKERTEAALSYGAFGAPTIIVHVDGKPHMFFGSDRMLLIAQLLGEKYEGPLNDLSKL